jgi:phosphatidylserine/phosphatidylglycerophosphate/cardiolipin synthase-like enzyme
LLVDGDYREALLQALDAARERIDIVMFSTIIYDDSSSKHPVRQVLDRVIARHRAGVAVRVVLDHGIPPSKRRPGEDPPSDQAYAVLKDAGVPVRWDEDDRTTHVKCVVIDGKTILMGSHNWSSSALTKNREWSVLLHDPALAAQVAEEIDRLWRR